MIEKHTLIDIMSTIFALHIGDGCACVCVRDVRTCIGESE